MRLTDCQIQTVCQLVRQVTGSQSRVRVFGSRLDDTAHGGDLDLMRELPESVDNPALMAIQVSALASRVMHGRKVDVLAQRTQPHAPAHPRFGIQRRAIIMTVEPKIALRLQFLSRVVHEKAGGFSQHSST